MGLIFLMGCLIQWLVITTLVEIGVVSSSSHLDTLPSTAPLSVWAAIFCGNLYKILFLLSQKCNST